MHKQLKFILLSSVVCLNASALQLTAEIPEPSHFDQQGKVIYTEPATISVYKALDKYIEPEWITENYVKKGELPPIEQRLPKEPKVFLKADMPDGIGEYGGVLRHVIGGRPNGWNWAAGNTQGWGGVNMGIQECLLDTASLFRVTPEKMEAMPNLAKSWQWSEDGHKLTMQLIEGARWSDGDPFDADDIMFYWEDNLLDKNVPSLSSHSTFGDDTILTKIDDYTIEWTFVESFPKLRLLLMSYDKFCPGPSHIFKPLHPKYNPDVTYNDYINSVLPDNLPTVTMGAWSVVEYKADDIMVLRRNPYYWKVDEDGHQLPYIDEVQYKLSTWSDRTIRTVAGSADFSNMEQPQNFPEALKRSAEENAPARLEFGARTIGYALEPNYSLNDWGSPDERGMEVRKLNRNLKFRQALTAALDRESLGRSLVRGPFTAIYTGGIMPGSIYYNKEDVTYYVHSKENAKALLDEIGLKDTDGNGFVNYTEGPLKGKDVEVVLIYKNEYVSDTTLAEGVTALLEEVGLRVLLRGSTRFEEYRQSGQFDWMVRRTENEYNLPMQRLEVLAPIGLRTSYMHRAGSDNSLELMDFEKELVEIVEKFMRSSDSKEQSDLMRQYNKIFTKNVYGLGLTAYSGALIINKRIKNIPQATPINAFQWAELGVIRERLFVPKSDRIGKELYPQTLPIHKE